jgi:hypothetical protein
MASWLPAGRTSTLLLLLTIGGSTAIAPSWLVARKADLFGVPFYEPSNTASDGSLVAARLAGASGGVSDTRALPITVTRFADATYAWDVATATAALYAAAAGPLMAANGTVVVSSSHRSALFAAEALHAPLLPAQTLAFAGSFAQACDAARGGDSLVLTGADYDWDGAWLWVKPAAAAGVPPPHVSLLAGARALLLLRATDSDPGEYLGAVPCSGGGALAIHSSLKALAGAPGRPATAALWAQAEARLVPLNDSGALRQWEWGLPDATVEAYADAWAALGKPAGTLTVVEGGVVDLYGAVPRLWRAYLAANGVASPRGVTVSGFWVAQPALERLDGVLPFPAYAFYKPTWRPIFDAAGAALAAVVAAGGAPAAAAHTRVFVNGVGSDTDREGAQLLLDGALGASAGAAVCEYGLDCPPAAVERCSGGAGGVGAHVAAARALSNATSLLPPRQWAPLTVAQVAAALAPQRDT